MNPLIPLLIGAVCGGVAGFFARETVRRFRALRAAPEDSAAGLAEWTGPSQPGDGPTQDTAVPVIAAVVVAPERHRHRAPRAAETRATMNLRAWGVHR